MTGVGRKLPVAELSYHNNHRSAYGGKVAINTGLVGIWADFCYRPKPEVSDS